MAPRRVTSTDVARAAGLSRTTVSYVLNGRAPNIPEATRERVLAAAAELNYQPSGPARALRRGASDLVVAVQPHWTMAYTVGLMMSRLTEQVSKLGLTLVITQASLDDDRVWGAVSPFAVLSWDAVPPQVAERLQQAGCTHVLSAAERTADLRGMARTHGRMAAEHLLAAGHVRIGYAAATDPLLEWFSQSRCDGVAQVLASDGDVTPVAVPVGTDPDLALDAVRAWRAADVTAVVAYNDDVALACLAAIRRLALRCPEDIAVTGMDNTPAGGCSVPSLTSVDMAPEATADLLAAMLAQAMGHADAEPVDPLDSVRVVVRESA